MHKKSWRQGKCISNLIRFFHFLSFSRKTSFFRFQHGIIFFLTTTIYSRHVSFFLPIFDHPKKYFFLKKWIRHSFFRFLFKIKYYPITRKKQNEKLFFVFFKNSKHTFFIWTRVKFFWILMTLIRVNYAYILPSYT